MNKQNRRTLIFFCFLLLGGACHTADKITHGAGHFAVSALMFCAVLLIYSGLILFWIQSVRRRLLPSGAGNCVIAAGRLMLLFLAVRAFKYRMVPASAAWLIRLSWYAYYIPIIMIPTLFLMTCLSFGDHGGQHGKVRRLPLIIGGMLTLGILTNDLHHLAFVPNIAESLFVGGDTSYTYGPLFYAAYIWAGCMIAAGVVNQIAVSRKTGSLKKAVSPFLCVLLIPLLTAVNNFMHIIMLPEPYKMPEILIFCMIGVFEACIRNRLLPHNEQYDVFFSRLALPVSITDKSLTTRYQSAIPVTADPAQMSQAIGSYIYPEPDMRLSGMELHAGYVFYAEDESSLHRLNEELEDANDMLALENELLEHEQELIEERAAIEVRNRLYDEAAVAVYPVQKRIAEILKQMQPFTDSFRERLARVLFMTAFVKRKANFVMLNAEHGSITPEELAVALKESAHYLRYCNMDASVNVTAQTDFSCSTAMAVYDCFEAVTELLCGTASELLVRVTETELLLLADAEQAPVLPELPLPFTCTAEDGQTTVRVRIGGAAS